MAEYSTLGLSFFSSFLFFFLPHFLFLETWGVELDGLRFLLSGIISFGNNLPRPPYH